jgi:hypothetical protein
MMPSFIRSKVRIDPLAGLALCAAGLALAACAPVMGTAPSNTETPTPPPPTTTATPSPTPTDTPTITLTPTLTIPPPTPTPITYDYQPMLDRIDLHLRHTAYRQGYSLGIGFVDIQTGQSFSIQGDQSYHAMSTFKGPLAAFYFWLLERGEITEQPGDREHMVNMLEVSSNVDTTCIFERVGGIPPFNDWLAEQGMSREHNFVFLWEAWACNDEGQYYIPQGDWRYTEGDESIGLPGDGRLLVCPVRQLPCDKAFAPVELAEWYAHLYRGEVLNADDTALLLSLLEEGVDESVFLNNLPDDAHVHSYVKGGTRQADELYHINFFHEAGILETDYGAFALALFMQGNPEWPGTWAMSEVARIAYEYFVAAHTGAPPPED